MKTVAPLPDDEEFPFRQLTAQEASELRERNPPVSIWWVVAAQLVVGLVVALVAWAATGKQNVGWSAGYGALAVVVPAAMFARGLSGRLASRSPGAATVRFLMWEMGKLGLTAALLLAAPRLVPALSWPALLVGLVLTVKVYWVALAYSPRRPANGN